MTPSTLICVFAKPHRPGTVKTRLAARTGPDAAARLARAFLQDTWGALESLTWAEAVIATTEPISGEALGVPGAEVWPQGEGDLGARIERVLRRALETHRHAIALGADTPGVPLSLLAQADEALRTSDAAVGPCEDGGFYLLGLRRCAPRLLADLPWSEADTCARTLERLREHGVVTSVLPSWFDVDRPEDLERLRDGLARGEVFAPRTAKVLAQIAPG